MSLATLERAIMDELREVSGNKKLRKKDLMEWSTGKVEAQEGEKVYFLPKLNMNVCIKVS